jgi:hypothetical protein
MELLLRGAIVLERFLAGTVQVGFNLDPNADVN